MAATAFTAGLVVAQVLSRPQRSIENRGQQYMRLLSLYSLAKTFERQHGQLPKTLSDLERWCKSDEIREAIFEEAEVLVAPSGEVVPWRIQSQGGGDQLFICQTELNGNVKHGLLGVTFDGEISTK